MREKTTHYIVEEELDEHWKAVTYKVSSKDYAIHIKDNLAKDDPNRKFRIIKETVIREIAE